MKTKFSHRMLKDSKAIKKTSKLIFWEKTQEFNMKKMQTSRQLAVDSVIQILDKQIEVQIRLSDSPFKMALMVVSYLVGLNSNYNRCTTDLCIKKKIHHLDLIPPSRDSHIWKKCKKWARFLDLALILTIWTRTQLLLSQHSHRIITLLSNKVWTRFRHREEAPSSNKNQSTSTIRARLPQPIEGHQI